MTRNEIALKTTGPKEWLLNKLNLPVDIDARRPVREWVQAQGMAIQNLREAAAEFRSHGR